MNSVAITTRATPLHITRKFTFPVICPKQQALIIATVFTCIQILDGIFTGIGIQRYGINIEGNPLLRAIMIEYGYVSVLISLKLIAISIILFLTYMSDRVIWIRGALASLSIVYLLGAIIPWIYVLFVHPAA